MKVGQPLFLPHLSKSVVAAETETSAFPSQLPKGNPREVTTSSPHHPHLSPGLCRGTQRGLSQSKVTATLSPPSQLTMFCLKLIIFLFLNPEAPAASTPAVPWTSVPACAGCQGTPQQRAPTHPRYLIQAGKTHRTRRGNQNVNTVVLSPLSLSSSLLIFQGVALQKQTPGS